MTDKVTVCKRAGREGRKGRKAAVDEETGKAGRRGHRQLRFTPAGINGRGRTLKRRG